VEGYLDVIALHQAGFPIAIAPLGTAITADHLRLAFGHCDHLTICLDGDAAGRRAALRTLQLAMPLITESRQLDYIRLPAGDDPDSLLQRHGQSAWQKLQQSPLSLEQAIVSLNAEGLDLTKPAARARLHRLVRDILGLIPDPVLRQEYHHALAQQLADWLAPYQQTMHQLPGKSAHSGSHSGTASKNRQSYANKNAQDGLDSFGTSSLHPMPPARLQQLQVASLLRVLMDNPDLWADVAEEARDLVDAVLHVGAIRVLRRGEVPPLVAVDRSEVTLLAAEARGLFRRRPLVPDANTCILQRLHVRLAAEEPEELLEDRLGVQLLRREEGEARPQIEAHLDTFGAELPSELRDELRELEKRLG
jgi:DNA primase